MSSYLTSFALVGLLVVFLLAFGSLANATTVALVLLLGVLVSASRWGSRVGAAAALVSVLAFNFFFLAPTGTLTIADPMNWVALGVFLAVALVAGELSTRARRRADEADASRLEAERLYAALQDAFSREAGAEAFRQSEQLKASLLDAVTHNLRTPITSIKASATALQTSGSTLDEEARKELVDVMGEEADRLNAMVEDLIGLAKIEGGHFRLAHAWCSLEDVVAGAVARVGRERRGQIRTALSPDVPVVRVDARATEEIVYQLLDNAVRYSPAGAPVVVSAAADSDERVEVVVDDEGPGVPADEQARIFEKFQRGTGAIGGGLGMGLAIARGLAREHGGDITVASRPGGPGARFVLTLPIGDDEAT